MYLARSSHDSASTATAPTPTGAGTDDDEDDEEDVASISSNCENRQKTAMTRRISQEKCKTTRYDQIGNIVSLVEIQ